MRLYLSSYRMGGGVDVLKGLLGRGRRVGIIENALDHIPAAERSDYKKRVYDSGAEFRALGFETVELDLRGYFGSEQTLRRDLAALDLIWAVGGNAFILRKAMASSGLDRVIRSGLDEDAFAYGGFSAGAVVLGPSLKGIEEVDDPNLAVEGYPEGPIWEGLGILDFIIVPHYRSAHRESALVGVLVERYQGTGTPHLPLSDGEVLFVDGAHRAIIDARGRERTFEG